MDTRILTDRVVFIKDPTALPKGLKHPDAIDALSRDSKLVILLSHGNKYVLPAEWIMPHNVRLLEYDLDMESIVRCVVLIKELLKDHGVDVYSRHLTNVDPMPIVLAGSCMTVRTGTELVFVNQPDQYNNAKATKTPPGQELGEWDLT